MEHEWHVASRHPTSEGEIRYETCRCGAHRIRLVPARDPVLDLAHPRSPAVF